MKYMMSHELEGTVGVFCWFFLVIKLDFEGTLDEITESCIIWPGVLNLCSSVGNGIPGVRYTYLL